MNKTTLKRKKKKITFTFLHGQGSVLEEAKAIAAEQLSRPEGMARPAALSTVPVPDELPDHFFDAIMSDNLAIVEQQRLMNVDYFRFMLDIVQHRCEVRNLSSLAPLLPLTAVI